MRKGRAGSLALLALLLGAAARGDDWPNWRGPHRDGISRETGLLSRWPAGGPRVLWKRTLTGGYSSMAVSAGRIVTQSKHGDEETVLCLDVQTGKQLWEFRYACRYDDHPTLDQQPSPGMHNGPRAAPAVRAGLVYTLGTVGDLYCLDLKTGKPVWSVDLKQIGERACPDLGYCHPPLIDGDRLYVHPGGQKGNSIAALDRRTGKVLWKALDDRIGYSAPVLIEHGGRKQLVYFTGEAAVGVDPESGRPFWRYPWKTKWDFNIATPIYADGHLFLSTSYDVGCALVRLKADGDPEQVYKNLRMHLYYSSGVLYQGHIYGFSNDRLRCLEMMTGKLKWDRSGFEGGAVAVADGKLLVLGETGELALADLDPGQYVERSRAKVLPGPVYTTPVLADGVLYARDERSLVALDLTGKRAMAEPGKAAPANPVPKRAPVRKRR